MTVADAQLSLFEPPRLARRPYATDDLENGVYRHSPEAALERAYIENNCSTLVWRMVLDIDREGAALAAEQAGVATPSWVAANPFNAHAHVGYELATAVCRSDAGRLRPLRYLAAVEDAYLRALGADVGYASLICKNPHSARWRVQVLRQQPYSMGELADYVDLEPYRRGQRKPAGALGRNVALFDSVREWAYREVRAARAAGSYEAWQRAVLRQVEAGNSGYHGLGLSRTDPLGLAEVRAIARSVAKWTWQQFDIEASDDRFSAVQAHRGRLGGLASGAVRFQDSITASQPWAAEGISRATWYRRRKAAGAV